MCKGDWRELILFLYWVSLSSLFAAPFFGFSGFQTTGMHSPMESRLLGGTSVPANLVKARRSHFNKSSFSCCSPEGHPIRKSLGITGHSTAHSLLTGALPASSSSCFPLPEALFSATSSPVVVGGGCSHRSSSQAILFDQNH